MKKIYLSFFFIFWVVINIYAQLGASKGDALEISTSNGATSNNSAISNNMMHKVWLLRNNNGSDWLTTSLHDGIAVDGSFLNPQVNTRTWWERNPADGSQSWGDTDQTFMVLSGGRLGLGTLTPDSKLEVVGDLNLKYNSSDGYWLRHTDLGGNIIAGFKRSGNDFLLRAFDGIGFSVGNTEARAVTILINGNFGIGTTTPQEKLTVNGKIRANEIKVDGAGTPDYVFEEGYKVATLKALESYIKANKHLPELPSAREMERDGMAVGEMNKLLLKKIEELTLHLIEKDKQYDELFNDMKKQASRLRVLEKKIVRQ
jgi:uncharacterized protein YaiE (UPF0345 family)